MTIDPLGDVEQLDPRGVFTASSRISVVLCRLMIEEAMVVRLVPRGVKECKQGREQRMDKRGTKTSKTRKEWKNNSITEYLPVRDIVEGDG